MPRPEGGGDPHGIENAHPFAGVTCVDCHGGDNTTYVESEAHVLPGTGPAYLRNLTTQELDEVNQDYLRFVNPGDLRVTDLSCGVCHADISSRVKNSNMGHTSGEITSARYRAGMQDENRPLYGANAARDDDFANASYGASPAIDRFNPPPITDLENASVGELQDDYMVRSCFRCHLSDFGENRFAGDYRSSGCTACHMKYSNDGASLSEDPVMPELRIPRPEKHELTSAVGTEQCMHCHYRGARIGPNYLGYRESAASGKNPEQPEVLGEALHGHDAAYYIVDEDKDNDYDETPPDVHATAGMECIDCHTEREVHGDGHIYSDNQVFVEIRCESCHGDIDSEATGVTALDNPVTNLEHKDDGTFELTSKVTEQKWEVPQLVHAMTEGHDKYSSYSADAMGRNENGYSHTDNMRCSTCHSAWMTSCYSCHITMDYSAFSRSQTTGERTLGRPAGAREWVTIDDLVLMTDPFGRISPSMPSERFFMTSKNADGEVVHDNQVRTAADGSLGFGQRTVEPHTIQKGSAWSACQRCHILPDRSNEALVRITVGYGSDRFNYTDGAGRVYRLDSLFDEDGIPWIITGHEESGPLPQETIDFLLNVPVETP
ncbi:MAG: hypothetical protein GY822_19930 [Deltaproteobacteria bacterium]|nr:hypothetical protein [Deltaproteobacteria bacterium]